MKIKGIILKISCAVAAFIAIGFLFWIVIYIFIKGIGGISWEFLTTAPYKRGGGILPQIVSTLYLVVTSVAIAMPIGVCSAIYLVEYAKQGKIVNVIRFAIECLSGIPSIIYALFGSIFFVTALMLGQSILAASLTLSIMILPLIIRTTEEALKVVPVEYSEGSLALGATKLRTIFKVVLPSAIPGILSGIILSIGRIIGESAAVFFTMGMVTRMPNSILDPGRTLAVHVYMQVGEGNYTSGYATAVVLIVLIAVINFAADKVAKLLSKKTKK